MSNIDLTRVDTPSLEEIASKALSHAGVYKTCRDGSYEACLAQYNYGAIKKELDRRKDD